MTGIIEQTGAVAQGHFVYKALYKHGGGYVNKEDFDKLGSRLLCQAIRQSARNAVEKGLKFDGHERIGVIGPAYGAIPFSLVLAEELERLFPGKIFFTARTELKELNGKKIHYLPDKLQSKYHSLFFLIFEDIVNNGTTIREVRTVFKNEAEAFVIAALALVNRGGQSTQSLGVPSFFPLLDIDMTQYDLKIDSCPLCQRGVPINTDLGKGAAWVKMFGQPPYPDGFDFSAFWEKNE